MAVTVKMLEIETAWPATESFVLPEGWVPLSVPDVIEVSRNRVAKVRIWAYRAA